MNIYQQHLSKDATLKKILASQDPIELHLQSDLFSYLCSSIISQQLSTKVAKVISDRFFALLHPSKDIVKQIIALEHETMRAVGLSNQKASYIHNLATFYHDNKKQCKRLHLLTDEELVEFLTQVKGIGQWTVEMVMMFAMQREDVFPVDDLGIQQAMCKLYAISTENKREMKNQMKKIASMWSPYRTYASMHLWKWKDN